MISLSSCLADELKLHGYEKESDHCLVQSFYLETLTQFREYSNLSLVFLMKSSLLTEIDPNDETVNWYDWYRWQEVSDLCFGVGPSKDLIIPKNENKIKFISNYVEVAHSFGLKVNPTRTNPITSRTI